MIAYIGIAVLIIWLDYRLTGEIDRATHSILDELRKKES